MMVLGRWQRCQASVRGSSELENVIGDDCEIGARVDRDVRLFSGRFVSGGGMLEWIRGRVWRFEGVRSDASIVGL